MALSSTSYRAGQSGNPSGTKGSIKLAAQQIRESCIEIAQRGLSVLEDILFDDQEKASTRLTALNIVLERGLGKPLQPIQVDSTDNLPPSMLTTAQLHAVIEGKFEEALAMGIKDGTLQEKIKLWEVPKHCTNNSDNNSQQENIKGQQKRKRGNAKNNVNN